MKIFDELDDFFNQFGVILFPFNFQESRKQKQQHCNGFYFEKTPEMLYIRDICFHPPHVHDLEMSALNVAFHELLHYLESNHKDQFHLLLQAVNIKDVAKFIYISELRYPLENIYSRDQFVTESVNRYITNNPETTPMLNAIYHKKDYTPNETFSLLYKTLKDILKYLKNRDQK